jgi:hypothetical protein
MGMNDDAQTARRYRQRAKEIRAILRQTENEDARRMLESVAEDYERLARARIRIGRLARPKHRPTPQRTKKR